MEGKPIQAIYIGRHGVHKQANNEIVVHNWQAPIGRLFYQRRAGRTNYETPEGIEHCDVLLRRNLQVNGKDLTAIVDDFDMREGANQHQVGDPYLLEVLNQQGTGYLQDIVATIQAEQDDVIRAEPLRPLVVQGVAGSGKTSVVFSRIAYLLYTLRATLKPENVLVVGPNRVFLEYTADLLPNLGIEEIKQTTFEDLVAAMAGRTFPVANREDALAAFMQAAPEEQNRLRHVAQLKGSLRFRQVLDRYAARLARRGISRLSVEHLPGLTEDKLRQWLEGDSTLPVNQRITRMARRLHDLVNNQTTTSIDRYRGEYSSQIRAAQAIGGEEGSRSMKELVARRNELIRALQIRAQHLDAQIDAAWRPINAEKAYRHLLSRPESLAKVAKELLNAEEVAAMATGAPELSDVDLASLAHFTRLIDGWNMKNVRRPGHVLVDEAEDLTPCELALLFDLTNHASFTLVGDLGQSVFSYRSPDEWQSLIDGVFGHRKATRANLLHSYRSTYEITTLANAIQARHQRADSTAAIPVERHGEQPVLKSLSTRKEWEEELVASVRSAMDKYTSIGVLARDAANCKTIHRILTKAELQPHLLLNSKARFYPGLVVLPVHVARGLEFDAAIVADAQESTYRDTMADATLLYVAVTRPRHTLTVLAQGPLSPLLPS